MTKYYQNLVLYFALFGICIAFWCIFAYLQHQPLQQALFSAGYGLLVFIIPQSIYRSYMHRRIVSAGRVVFQLIYAHILKYMIFIFLFALCFKFLELDNKIVVLTFVFASLFEVAFYSFFRMLRK